MFKLFIQYGVFIIIGITIMYLSTFFVDEGIKQVDNMLVPCQHGTSYIQGKCRCDGTPYNGTYCSNCMCEHGFCSTEATTPFLNSDYGCRCPTQSKRFGFLCDMCNTIDEIECKGECKPEYFGIRCEKICYANLEYENNNSVCNTMRNSGGVCNACHGHGTCEDGECKCDSNWFSKGRLDCVQTCPGEPACSGHGSCQLYGDTAGCLCEEGWNGKDCNIPCPGVLETGKACNEKGTCVVNLQDNTATCDCFEKFRGEQCNIECPGDVVACNGHGTCDDNGICTCDSNVQWSLPSCKCSDELTCNLKGECNSDEKCECFGHNTGEKCLECERNWHGNNCDLYCDPYLENNVSYLEEGGFGCYGHGTCLAEENEVSCTCNLDSIQRLVVDGTVQDIFSYYESDFNCGECEDKYFPKKFVVDQYGMPDGYNAPCENSCEPSTCNHHGICNHNFGIPGEKLCACNLPHVDDDSFCTECETNWYPLDFSSPKTCSKFCIDSGPLPDECDGTIDCVSCNGHGSCTEEGTCLCEGTYTGDQCQIQCTGINGLVCGGHGTCGSTAIQLLMEHEFKELGDAPLFSCTCDPQDPVHPDTRIDWDEKLAAGLVNGTLDPPPIPEYYGETCDFACVKPPWEGSDECNGMGNCTIVGIRTPANQLITCQTDHDCQNSFTIQQIISGDASWSDRKGPFCHKEDDIQGCSKSTDDCYEILLKQRPRKMRSEECVTNSTCYSAIESENWYDYCVEVQREIQPVLFEACNSVASFCPAKEIPPYCKTLVDYTDGIDVSFKLNYIYEYDKKHYPLKISEEYRTNTSTLQHDLAEDLFKDFEHNVDLVITDAFCENFNMRYPQIDTVRENKQYLCNGVVSNTTDCIGTLGETILSLYKPFVVVCLNSNTSFSTYEQAMLNRGTNCKVVETEKDLVYVEEDGKNHIDSMCNEITRKFPSCTYPSPCDFSPCSSEDYVCENSGTKAICTTTGDLNSTCKKGVSERISYSSYSCDIQIPETSCPNKITHEINLAKHCKDNNPILYQIDSIGNEETKTINPGNYIHFEFKASDAIGTGTRLDFGDAIRVYVRQGQIQLNEIEKLQSCPVTNQDCNNVWSYTKDIWYHIELELNSTHVTMIRKDTGSKISKVLLSSNSPVSVATVPGSSIVEYRNIFSENDIPSPFDCEYETCSLDVSYREICSDIIRNVEYPSLLLPKHDPLTTCSNYFDNTRLPYDGDYLITEDLYNLDWNVYCLFYTNLTKIENLIELNYSTLENYTFCQEFVDPVDGNKQCIDDALSYNWTLSCQELLEAQIPSNIKNACPKQCYNHLLNYTDCDDMFEIFSADKTVVDEPGCSVDWYDYCLKDSKGILEGTCSAVECDCDYETYEGVTGESCQLHCPVASDSTACGEGTNVGKCVYTKGQQAQIQSGPKDEFGNSYAFKSQWALEGECQCFNSEGNRACDIECLDCKTDLYPDGQISICDNTRGICDCLPPFVQISETTEINWRGKNTTKIQRIYNSGNTTGKDLYRIRMMQGQESFVKHALQISDGVPAYADGDDWESTFLNFVDNPQNYWCYDKTCDVGDTTLSSNLDSTSSRYNFNCGSECPGTNETTKIPCSGHGICGASGQCVCDPAKIVVGEDSNGFKQVFQYIPGVVSTFSTMNVDKLDRTGYRGDACEITCRGYDEATGDMTSLCNGHGKCDLAGACACEVGWVGEDCQFKCPGFEEGDTSLCSGHGTCQMATYEITDNIFKGFQESCEFQSSRLFCMDYPLSIETSIKEFDINVLELQDTGVSNIDVGLCKQYAMTKNLYFHGTIKKYYKVADGECTQQNGQIKMYEGNGDNSGADYIQKCAEACLSGGAHTSLSGSWDTFKVKSFIIATSGECYCENRDIDDPDCTLVSNTYDKYDFNGDTTKPSGCIQDGSKVYFNPRKTEQACDGSFQCVTNPQQDITLEEFIPNTNRSIINFRSVNFGVPDTYTTETDCQQYATGTFQSGFYYDRPVGCVEKNNVVYFNKNIDKIECGYDSYSCIKKYYEGSPYIDDIFLFDKTSTHIIEFKWGYCMYTFLGYEEIAYTDELWRQKYADTLEECAQACSGDDNFAMDMVYETNAPADRNPEGKKYSCICNFTTLPWNCPAKYPPDPGWNSYPAFKSYVIAHYAPISEALCEILASFEDKKFNVGALELTAPIGCYSIGREVFYNTNDGGGSYASTISLRSTSQFLPRGAILKDGEKMYDVGDGLGVISFNTLGFPSLSVSPHDCTFVEGYESIKNDPTLPAGCIKQISTGNVYYNGAGILTNAVTCSQVGDSYSCVERLYSNTINKKMSIRSTTFKYEHKMVKTNRSGNTYSWENTKCIGAISTNTRNGTLTFNQGHTIDFVNTGLLPATKAECTELSGNSMIVVTSEEYPLGCSIYYSNIDGSDFQYMWKDYLGEKTAGSPDETVTENGCKEYALEKTYNFETIEDFTKPFGCSRNTNGVVYNTFLRSTFYFPDSTCDTEDVVLLYGSENPGSMNQKINRCSLLCHSMDDCLFFTIHKNTYDCRKELEYTSYCTPEPDSNLDIYQVNPVQCSSSNICIYNKKDYSNGANIETPAYFSNIEELTTSSYIRNYFSASLDLCREYAFQNGLMFNIVPYISAANYPNGCSRSGSTIHYNNLETVTSGTCTSKTTTGFYTFQCEIKECGQSGSVGDGQITMFSSGNDYFYGIRRFTESMCCNYLATCLEGKPNYNLLPTYNRRVCVKPDGTEYILDHSSDKCNEKVDIDIVCATFVETSLDNLVLYEVEKDNGVCLRGHNDIVFAFGNSLREGFEEITYGVNTDGLDESECVKYSEMYGLKFTSRLSTIDRPVGCFQENNNIYFNTADQGVGCSNEFTCIDFDRSVRNQLCMSSGDADDRVQGSIEAALTSALQNCSDGKFYDLLSGTCQSASQRPLIQTTFYQDKGTIYEKENNVTCEIINEKMVSCPKCECFGDSLSGHWDDFECSNCAETYGNIQCNQECPGGTSNQCNGNGVCIYGSDSLNNIFQPAKCMCGQTETMSTPEGGECYIDVNNVQTDYEGFTYIAGKNFWNFNDAQSECCKMDDFSKVSVNGYCFGIYREMSGPKYILAVGFANTRTTYRQYWKKTQKITSSFTYDIAKTNTQQSIINSEVKICNTFEEIFSAGEDVCNHFSSISKDCSRCEQGFNGRDCRLRCQNCLMGGICDESPSEKIDAACTCPEDIPGLWNKNCCPIGFRVDNVYQFETLSNEELNSIQIPQTYTEFSDNELDASYWCKPCPGIQPSDWFANNALYKVCGGSGECKADPARGENICVCDEGFFGRSCMCQEVGNLPYIDEFSKYSCSGNDIKCPTSGLKYLLSEQHIAAITNPSGCKSNYYKSFGTTLASLPYNDQLIFGSGGSALNAQTGVLFCDADGLYSSCVRAFSDEKIQEFSGLNTILNRFSLRMTRDESVNLVNFGSQAKYLMLIYEDPEVLPSNKVVEVTSNSIKVTDRKAQIEICYPVMALEYTYERFIYDQQCIDPPTKYLDGADNEGSEHEQANRCARLCTARPQCESFNMGTDGSCYEESECTAGWNVYDGGRYLLKTTTIGECFKNNKCVPNVPCHLGEGPCIYDEDCAGDLQCRSGSIPGFSIVDVGPSYKYCAIPTTQSSVGSVCSKKPDILRQATSTLTSFDKMTSFPEPIVTLQNENIEIPYKGGRLPNINDEYKYTGTWGKYVPQVLDGDDKVVIHDREYDCPKGTFGVYANMFIGDRKECGGSGGYSSPPSSNNLCCSGSYCGSCAGTSSFRISTSELERVSQFFPGKCMACPAGTYSDVAGLSGLDALEKQTQYQYYKTWSNQYTYTTYIEPIWSKPCTQCPGGKTSGVGSTSINDCVETSLYGDRHYKRVAKYHSHKYNDFYSDGGPKGKLGDEDSVNPRTMTLCPEGSIWDASVGKCKACSAKCHVDGSGNCSPCQAPSGCYRLSDSVGQTSCTSYYVGGSYCYTQTGETSSDCAFDFVPPASDFGDYAP